MRRTLLRASARVDGLTRGVLRRDRLDLAYISVLAPHQTGHLFWDVSQLEVDLAATVYAALGVDDAPPGEPLLERP